MGGPISVLRNAEWDDLFTGAMRPPDLRSRAMDASETQDEVPTEGLLPPIESQEVWAAGVTYLRSRTARMEESAKSGGSYFYDLVYEAHRPELFFKATPHRVVGSGQPLSLRSDSSWMVPEPELTLAFTSSGGLLGYTIGNDLSSRDIEGENPLYLPQAKVFNHCAGLGPALLVTDQFPPPETQIELSIRRSSETVFTGSTVIAQMKQSFENLREHLFRDNSFPQGCFLMTGTGIVPADGFTLQRGDEIAITIDAVGTLVNTVE
jgi:2-dehydro-3-deoxy-D-arabinonate dehydratase